MLIFELQYIKGLNPLLKVLLFWDKKRGNGTIFHAGDYYSLLYSLPGNTVAIIIIIIIIITTYNCAVVVETQEYKNILLIMIIPREGQCVSHSQSRNQYVSPRSRPPFEWF